MQINAKLFLFLILLVYVKYSSLLSGMKTLTLHQQDVEQVISSQYPNLTKEQSIKHVKTIFGSTANDSDINIAYKSLGK